MCVHVKEREREREREKDNENVRENDIERKMLKVSKIAIGRNKFGKGERNRERVREKDRV